MRPSTFLRTVAVAATAAALSLLACGPAFGARGHAFSLAFPSGTKPEIGLSLVAHSGTKGVVSGMAVSAVSGDVFVTDTGNRRIVEFSSSGAFVRAWGWGVATGAAELQVCTSSCLAGLSGSEPGEFVLPTLVAVDNDPSSASYGDVYVGDGGDNLVTKFDAEGHLISSWGNNGENASKERVEPNGQLNGETSPPELFSHGEPLIGIATDGSGNLWVLTSSQKLFEFSQLGAFQTKCTYKPTVAPKGLAVGATGFYSVEAFGQTSRVPPGCGTGALLTSEARPASGLAVDAHEGDLYVDGGGELIEDLPAGCVLTGSSCRPRTVFGETGEAGVLHEGGGVAIDPQSGTVYVTDVGTQQVFAYPVVVEANAAAATEVGAHEAVLHGTVTTDGSQLSRCEFEYGTSEAYGSVLPCEESVSAIGSGSSPVAVHAKAAGLFGGTQYRFRLRAANAHGDVRSEGEGLTTSKTARVVSVAAKEVTGASALLEAVVNPEGLETKYRFQVGPCTTLAECPSAGYPTELPERTLAAGSANVPVSERVEGLTAGQVYHFRLFVEGNGGAYPDPEGTAEGTFLFSPPAPACTRARPQAGSDSLPDCRGYELVTPPFKNGGLIESGPFLEAPAISRDGGRVIANSLQCFGEPRSCTAVRGTPGVPFAFERGAEGWTARPLDVPTGFSGATWLAYRAESARVLYAAPPGEGLPEELYVRESDGTLNAVGPLQEAPGLAVANEAVSSPLVASEDLSHVAYDGQGLWSFDAAGGNGGVYVYPGFEGAPVLANVTDPTRTNKSLIGVCGATLGGFKQVPAHFNTLSADGRTVIFTVEPCATGTGENAGVAVPAGSIYERIEGAGGQMKTVLVSRRAPGGGCSSTACLESTPEGSEYGGGASDGSRVYFLSTQQLTNGASEDRRKGDTAVGAGCPLTSADTGGCNLYLWECPLHCEGGEGTTRLVDVSAGDTSGLGPQVRGTMGISEDGSSVYFVAHGVLVGPKRAGVAPAPGANNLYVWGPDGEGHERVAFVGALAASDSRQWQEGLGFANVSPDGRFLVFTSHRALTPDVARLEGPAQVYRYDARNETLLRVSIGQEGFDDNGNNGTGDAAIVRSLNGFEMGGRADPTMSDDGRLVFFESPVGLTPGALNDQHVTGNANILAENVYEWQAPGAQPSAGAPACEQPGGCVRLISDGRDLNEGSKSHENEAAVHLLGSDASGQNVFFETADQLVAQDTDTQVDIYDARVDGGFPAPATPGCEAGQTLQGEACRPPAGPGSVFGAPTSVTFTGPGNTPSELTPPAGKPTPRGLTPAQKLKRALASCRKRYRARSKRRQRAKCEKTARKRYGPVTGKQKGKRK